MWEHELRFAELPILQEKLEIFILRCNALIFKILANHLKNVRQAIPLCGTKDRTEGLLLWAFYPLQPPHPGVLANLEMQTSPGVWPHRSALGWFGQEPGRSGGSEENGWDGVPMLSPWAPGILWVQG